jgi:hypothetical protein
VPLTTPPSTEQALPFSSRNASGRIWWRYGALRPAVQHHARPLRHLFGTFDDIPNQSYAREQLAIRSDWKPEVSEVQRYRFPDGDPIRIQESVVGPQPDPGLGRELPGGGTQLEILDNADRARLIPVGDPADLPC